LTHTWTSERQPGRAFAKSIGSNKGSCLLLLAVLVLRPVN